MEVSQDIINYFRQKYPFITEEDVNEVLKLISFKKLGVGDYFVRIGEINTNVFYVVSGLLKAYYFDENDRETIINFYTQHSITGNWHSTLKNEPSQQCIEAVEPTLIIQVPLKDMDDLAARQMNIMRVYNLLLKEKLIASLDNIWDNMNEKPEARYLRLQNEKPDLMHRLTQRQIAAYLGVTPVSLSRIKKRLYSKKID